MYHNSKSWILSNIESLYHVKLHAKNLSKVYEGPNYHSPVLNRINLKIMEGEFVTIIGKSGCGKSTLLNIIAGLDKSYTGELLVEEKPSPVNRFG